MTRVLVVDNHDSFVHTLISDLQQLGAEVTIRQADEIGDPETVIAGFDAVMISPGPGAPEHAGASPAIAEACRASSTPLLGVCLGHQVIAVTSGANVTRAPELRHGETSEVHHDGSGIFEGIPSPFVVGRYHSLAVERVSVRAGLTITGATAAGTVMAVSEDDAPVWGVQFHPESVLTEYGFILLANWLRLAGDDDARGIADALPHARA